MASMSPLVVPTGGDQTIEIDEPGRRLRTAREARDLSKLLVANALDLPRTVVTRLEAGNRSVSTLELSRLSGFYFGLSQPSCRMARGTRTGTCWWLCIAWRPDWNGIRPRTNKWPAVSASAARA